MRKHSLFRSLTALVLLLAMGATVTAFLSLPPVHGLMRVKGLEQPVRISRDMYGVPSITARSAADGFFALGYLHAQDRLWQMEGMRRLGAGRLSEIVGQGALDIDIMMRTLGLYRLAEGDVSALPDESMAQLVAYAAGVNAWISDERAVLPPEFSLLGFEPEPWQPADSVVWGRIMAMRLSGNWRTELLRLGLSDKLSAQQIAELWPTDSLVAPVTLPADRQLTERMLPLIDAIDRSVPPTTASNAWVLGGARTATGAPILANDPHLGFSAPVLWYLARLELPDDVMVGATVPGVPAFLLGRNRNLAWGMTTTHSDTQDLFIERTDPDNPDRYRTRDGWKAFDERWEEIRVHNGDPVRHRVRMTERGPVISDVESVPTGGTVLSLRAASLEPLDGIASAVMRLGTAASVDEAIEEMRAIGAPQQNVFLADRSGATAMISPGRVPIRRTGDGRLPQSGVVSGNNWSGFVPFADLPLRRGLPDGWIANANNRLVDDGYPHLLTADWPPADRMKRLADQLDTEPPRTVDANRALQMDSYSAFAASVLPSMTRGAVATSEQEKMILQSLTAWDHVMDEGKTEPLMFALWVRIFSRRLYADETGDFYSRIDDPRPDFLRHVLNDPSEKWCDDVTTIDKTETCSDILTQSLNEVAGHFSGDLGGETWGDRHHAVFSHPVLQYIPVVSGFATLSAPTSGGFATLNRGSYGRDRSGTSFPHIHGAAYRAVYDLSANETATVIIAGGQSGNPLSLHYRDLMGRWLSDDRLTYSTLPGRFSGSPHQQLELIGTDD
ncbi:MAG: penicillin acylase family protein [Rhodospirillales bacterium]